MNKIKALCFTLAMPLMGCGWFSIGATSHPKVPVTQTLEDGSSVVAIEKFALQLTQPSDVKLRTDVVTDRAVAMYWRDERRNHGVQVDIKSAFMHEDLASMKKEYRTSHKAFSVGAGKELSNGFELYYSYWAQGDKRIGYQAELTIDGKKFRCFASGGSVTMAAMKQVRSMCRSLSKLDRTPPKLTPQ